MTSATIRVSGLTALAFLWACSPAPDAGLQRCGPGVLVACSCDDGTTGVRECGASGSLGACTCGEPGGAEPDPTGEADFLLDLGPVPLGDRASAAIRVRNPGTEPLAFRFEGVAPPFRLESTDPLTLARGQAGELRWGYGPVAEGAASQVAGVEVNGGVFRVRLTGEGFEPRLDCEGEGIDFGVGPVNVEVVGRSFACTNTSTRPLALVAGPVVGGGDFGVVLRTPEPVRPGAHWFLVVTAVGREVGTAEATVALATTGGRVLR